MLVHDWTQLRKLALILILACGNAHAGADQEPAGLAVYAETSRDIYLAALLMPAGASLDNVYLAPGPKAMEYRITTRRISSRGFFGTLLLQAELGSGSRASERTIEVLNQLKPIFKASLIKGDHFVITLSEDDATTFYLNDTRLLGVDDGSVFDFFFAGWVGEFSSTLLRDKLLAGKLDAAILARYEALNPGAKRVAAIAEWLEPATEAATEKPQQVARAPKPAAATAAAATAAAAIPARKAVAKSGPVEATVKAKKALSAATTASSKTSSTVATGAEPKVAKAAQVKAPEKEKPVQLSVREIVPESVTGNDNIEYQREIARYVTNVMKLVFGKLNYPHRAITKQREGRVSLLAHLDKTGELLELTLDNSSGYTMLDDAARKAVHRAAPFPELPPEAIEEFAADDGESYVVMIPITFKLQN